MSEQLYGLLNPLREVVGLFDWATYQAMDEADRDGLILVPDETVVGSTFINGVWTHPYKGPPRTVEEAGYTLDKIDRPTFNMLFTVPEEDAINRVAAAFSMVKVLVDRLRAADNVNLLLSPVRQSIQMMAGLPGTLLVPSRVANILAGRYPTASEQYASALRHQYFYGVPGDEGNPGHGTPLPE